MSLKAIHKVWTFKSSSSDKTYQTLLYTDSATSCDCPGWTRRAPTNAVGAICRTCRHTRLVDLGRADSEAINFVEYDKAVPVAALASSFGKALKKTGYITTNDEPEEERAPYLPYGHRKLCI